MKEQYKNEIIHRPGLGGGFERVTTGVLVNASKAARGLSLFLFRESCEVSGDIERLPFPFLPIPRERVKMERVKII